ncbi:MAG: 30S ribosomal protein S1 [Smithellaceae bacterium]
MDDTKTFAELFEESYATPKRFSVGEKVEATIVKISPEWIFIDLGAKSEGYIDKQEFLDEAGSLTIQEGDTVTAYFLSSRHSERLFTTKLLARKSVDEFLFNAFQNAIPLEAVVEKEIKGGFSVKISDNASGFCPYSQMDRRRIENATDYVGKKLEFIVIEYGENGRKIILSRRPLLEKIDQERIAKLKLSLQKGMAVHGIVTSVRDFGAFVDIGGIQALLPVSEMTWGRVEDTRSLYKPGDTIEAIIINLDWENDRITLSFKDTLPDPWNEVVRNYIEGSVHKGRVSRLTDFGAFITLEAGVDGLLHISKLGKGKKIKHAQDVLTRDREIDVKIEKIDRDNKRISLDLAQKGDENKDGSGESDDYASYMPKPPKTMGTFGDLLNKSKKKK